MLGFKPNLEIDFGKVRKDPKFKHVNHEEIESMADMIYNYGHTFEDLHGQEEEALVE